MPNYYLEAYGCSASFADSEILRGLLEQSNYNSVDRPDKADLNIIVTCTVKTATSNRMVHRIRELGKTGKSLIVAGCMGKTEKSIVEAVDPTASLLGPNSLDSIVDCANFALKGGKSVYLESSGTPKTDLPRVRKVPLIQISEIASGCLSACTFCQVKIARGRLVSYPLEKIVGEVTDAVRRGCKEVWLTSQDNGCYGKDIHTSLPELLQNVCAIQGEFMVRVGMVNPIHIPNMLDELVDAYENPKVFKFLHAPVQSGSDKILRLMLRGHTSFEYMRLIKEFKHKVPGITLSTDVIVGFPTETEEDFSESVNLLIEVEPDIVNISRFGARPGTKAATMPQIDPMILKRRSERMHELVRGISFKRNQRWMNWRGEIIVDEAKENGMVGRNYTYKPIFVGEELPLGSMPDVVVEHVSPLCLVAKRI